MKLREALIEIYRKQCQYCNGTFDQSELEIEHIFPRSKGGTDDLSNLTVSCRPCNFKKMALVLPEPGMSLLKSIAVQNAPRVLKRLNETRETGDFKKDRELVLIRNIEIANDFLHWISKAFYVLNNKFVFAGEERKTVQEIVWTINRNKRTTRFDLDNLATVKEKLKLHLIRVGVLDLSLPDVSLYHAAYRDYWIMVPENLLRRCAQFGDEKWGVSSGQTAPKNAVDNLP